MFTRRRLATSHGQACVEFALLLLVFVAAILALYDFACALRVSNSIANMSREGANLASRPTAGVQDDPQALMNTLALTAQPLDMSSKGMIFITVVQGDTIQKQEAWEKSPLKNSISSKIGSPSPGEPHPKASNLAALNLTPDQTAYIVEVFYNYQSLFSNNVITLANQFYSRTVF